MCAEVLSRPTSESARSDLPDRGRRTTPRSPAEWSADQVIAPGDSHDKGELSLCVGEAA
jgi:hypothetical protein